MADSRRINSNIREEESRLSEEEQPALSLSSIILSSEFWPPLKEEKLELPPLVCQAMEAYTHRYEKLKVGRPDGGGGSLQKSSSEDVFSFLLFRP